MTGSNRFASVALLSAAAMLASCTSSDSKAATDTVGARTAPESAAAGGAATNAGKAPAAPLSFADLAGTWQMRAVPESGPDTTATQYTLTATRDSTGWKAAYKNGTTLPLRVATSGDSLITDTRPHMSVRGKGVMTTTHSIYRRDGDRLVGRTVAHYATKGADSVITLRAEGTRVH